MLGVVCVSFLHPPFVFIGGSHGQGELHLQLILSKLTYTSNQELPRQRFESVGHLVGPPTFLFGLWVAL